MRVIQSVISYLRRKETEYASEISLAESQFRLRELLGTKKVDISNTVTELVGGESSKVVVKSNRMAHVAKRAAEESAIESSASSSATPRDQILAGLLELRNRAAMLGEDDVFFAIDSCYRLTTQGSAALTRTIQSASTSASASVSMQSEKDYWSN